MVLQCTLDLISWEDIAQNLLPQTPDKSMAQYDGGQTLAISVGFVPI